MIFGNSSANSLAAGPQNGSSLTIGPGILAHGQRGYIGYSPYLGGSNVSFLNQGTIAADGGGELLAQFISNLSSGTLTGGTWRADANGTLRLSTAESPRMPLHRAWPARAIHCRHSVGQRPPARCPASLRGVASSFSTALCVCRHLSNSPAHRRSAGHAQDQRHLTQAATGSLTLSIGGPPYDGLFLPWRL